MNKNVIIYHGSQQILTNPEFPFRKKPYYDFGQGFYCTADRELAMEWACPANRDGYVNRYELNTEDLKVIDLTRPPYSLLSWFALLLRSRKFDITGDLNSKARVYTLSNFVPAIGDADVLIGYRADDGYFAAAEQFFNDRITLRQLAELFRRNEPCQQIVLLTEKAYSHLTFTGYETADSRKYYYLRTQRDASMMEALEEKKVSPALPDDSPTIFDIIREVMRHDDPRIQSSLSE